MVDLHNGMDTYRWGINNIAISLRPSLAVATQLGHLKDGVFGGVLEQSGEPWLSWLGLMDISGRYGL